MKYIKIILLLSVLFVKDAHTKMVPYTEDPYLLQAPQEIVEIAQKAATLIGFGGPYEIIAPKKAGIEINPWNQFIAHGINPVTNNSLIIVNPEWIERIPYDQKLFLFGRSFEALKEGINPWSLKVVWYIYYLLGIVFLFLIFWLLGKTQLIQQKKAIWLRIILAFGIITVSDALIFTPICKKIKDYVVFEHDMKIIKNATQKLDNKNAAVNALHYFDSSIKEKVINGETIFTLYHNTFATYANKLERNS